MEQRGHVTVSGGKSRTSAYSAFSKWLRFIWSRGHKCDVPWGQVLKDTTKHPRTLNVKSVIRDFTQMVTAKFMKLYRISELSFWMQFRKRWWQLFWGFFKVFSCSYEIWFANKTNGTEHFLVLCRKQASFPLPLSSSILLLNTCLSKTATGLLHLMKNTSIKNKICTKNSN